MTSSRAAIAASLLSLIAGCSSTTPQTPVDGGTTAPVDGALADGGTPPRFVPVGPDRVRLGAIAATPTSLFVATSASVRRSRDGGASWTILPVPELHDVSAMVARGAELFVIAGAHSVEATFRSRDDGETWEQLPPPGDLFDLQQLSTGGDEVLLRAGFAALRWSDETSSWNRLPPGNNFDGFDSVRTDGHLVFGSDFSRGTVQLDLARPVPEWEPATLDSWGYAAFAFAEGTGFTVGTEACSRRELGVWTTVADVGFGRRTGEGEGPAVDDLLFDGGVLYASALDGLYESSDRGATWTRTVVDSFAARNALVSSGPNVFAAATGGLWRRSAERGWERLPLEADQVSGLIPIGSSVVAVAASGILRHDGAGWEPSDATGVSRVYSTAVLGGEVFLATGRLFASDDEGRTFTLRGPDDYVSDVTALDGGLISTQYVDGVKQLSISTDGGRTWGPFATFPPAEAQGVTQLVEVGGTLVMANFRLEGIVLHRSLDRVTWSDVALDPSLGVSTSLVVAGGQLFVGTSEGGVARSSDQGATWQSAGLDGLPIGALASHGGVVLAGVGGEDGFEGGVYVSRDGGASWARYDDQLDARVSALAVHDGRVYAGTRDQSTWAAPLP